jgi:4-cresol dehydrogenase (hydroxylating)
VGTALEWGDGSGSHGDIFQYVCDLEVVLPTAFSLWNDCKMSSVLGQYPWKEARGRTPLSEALRRRLRDAQGLGPWHLSFPLQAPSEEQVVAAQGRVEALLKEVVPTLA